MKTRQEIREEEQLILRSGMLVESADERRSIDTSTYSLDHPEVVKRKGILLRVSKDLPENFTWRLYYSTNDIGWQFVNLGIFIPN